MTVDPTLFKEIVEDAINYCIYMAGSYSGQVEESLWEGKKQLYQTVYQNLTVNIVKQDEHRID